MTCDRAVSKESRACIEMMKNAHLVLFGTEDGGEIVGHGECDVMNALSCDESELRRVFNLELVVGLSGRCARAWRLFCQRSTLLATATDPFQPQLSATCGCPQLPLPSCEQLRLLFCTCLLILRLFLRCITKYHDNQS